MKDYMMKLKKMLCDELKDMSTYKSLSIADTEAIKNMLSAIKNIDKIEMLEDDSDYSEYYPYDDRGNSYARRGTHYVRGHYSRDEAKDHMMNKIGSMMEDADPKEREILKQAMRKLEEA